MSSIPIISALPQFGGQQNDMLASASPIYQALLSNTGGNLSNVDELAASQPGFAQSFSMFSPSGGISPQQSSQFGPLFGLLLSLFSGQQPGS